MVPIKKRSVLEFVVFEEGIQKMLVWIEIRGEFYGFLFFLRGSRGRTLDDV